MSLIKCPECGKEISDKSVQCIHCGYPLNNKTDISQDVIYAGYESNTVKYKNQRGGGARGRLEYRAET